MITDNQIDQYYTTNYDMLEKIAKGIIYTQNKTHLDASLMIAESFIHIKKIQKDIPNEHQLQRNIIHFIKMNIRWQNSQVNLQNKLTQQQELENFEEYFDMMPQDDIDVCLEQKIEIEKWYVEKKCILEMYRSQLTDLHKQRIFDCFFKKGLNTGIKLAEHLKQNKTYCYAYIRTMKDDIKQYYDEYQSFVSHNNIKPIKYKGIIDGRET